MDNGLIFPYPCVGAPDESILLTAQSRRGLRSELVERGILVGSS